MGFLTGTVMALLAAAGGALYYRRVQRTRGRGRPRLDDDLIRRIEATGRVDVEEPLDIESIQQEEERFWEETAWEEPDEW